MILMILLLLLLLVVLPLRVPDECPRVLGPQERPRRPKVCALFETGTRTLQFQTPRNATVTVIGLDHDRALLLLLMLLLLMLLLLLLMMMMMMMLLLLLLLVG